MMAAVEERLARLEAEYETLKPSLSQRLERLESVIEKPPRKWFARLIAWLGPALPQLIGSAVLLILAFWVKDSVDLAIKQQQLQLSYVGEMKAQLETMAKEDATVAQIERAAVLIAAFGQPAIMPLMNELRYGGNRAIGAETGLRSLAFMNRDAVCELIPRIIKSPTRLLNWEGQMVSARIVAAGNCTSALASLQEQQILLKDAVNGNEEGLKKIVEIVPAVRQRKLWLASLQEAIRILSADNNR
jgi:hypothetical protein